MTTAGAYAIKYAISIMGRGLAAAEGDDEPDAKARAWPVAIRWRGEWDKVGVETVSPLLADTVCAREAYVRSSGRAGDAWLFPRPTDATKPVPKATACLWLRNAERKAKVPRLPRGGWHMLRRRWAQQRKHLPPQDVMAAGGWTDTKALTTAYQSADPETMLRVMQAGEKAG